MNQLTLVRPDESVNTHHPYSIHINGKQTTEIPNSSKQLIEVEENTVRIKAKIGWAGSLEKVVEFHSMDMKKLKVEANKFYNRLSVILVPLHFRDWPQLGS